MLRSVVSGNLGHVVQTDKSSRGAEVFQPLARKSSTVSTLRQRNLCGVGRYDLNRFRSTSRATCQHRQKPVITLKFRSAKPKQFYL